MTIFTHHKISTLVICLISISSLFVCLRTVGKPTEKIGHHLQKIKEIEYKRSLKKIDDTSAAKEMMLQMNKIQKLNRKISDNEPIKKLLTTFLNHWNAESKILASLTDGNQGFMTDITAFFMRGYIKYKDGWKTLFPIFKT